MAWPLWAEAEKPRSPNSLPVPLACCSEVFVWREEGTVEGHYTVLNIAATTNYYDNSSKQKIGIFSLTTGTQGSKTTKKPSLYQSSLGGRAAPTNKPKSWKLAEKQLFPLSCIHTASVNKSKRGEDTQSNHWRRNPLCFLEVHSTVL